MTPPNEFLARITSTGTVNPNFGIVAAGSYSAQTSSPCIGKVIITANDGSVLKLVNQTGFDQFFSAGGVNAAVPLEKIA